MPAPTVREAYDHCLAMARGHYENFPVASFMLPHRLREPVAAIYAFARTADDFADEGDLTPADRLKRLDDYARRIDGIGQGRDGEHPIFVALADTVARHRLPLAPFHDLLDAFRLDVTKKRYANFDEVMAYCRCSADPVGRLLLHLYDAATSQNLAWSDAVCSALQLINFWQDLAQDFEENDRIYIPQDEIERFGVTEDHFRRRLSDEAMARLIRFQTQRARDMICSGAPLCRALPGRIGLELRLIVMGGLRVLAALEAQEGNLFSRPRLRPGDYLAMLWGALRGPDRVCADAARTCETVPDKRQ